MAMRVYGLYQKSRPVMALLSALALCGVTVGFVGVVLTHGFRGWRNEKWAVISDHSTPTDSMAMYETENFGCIYLSSQEWGFWSSQV